MIELRFATPRDAEILARHIGAAVHPRVLSMIWDCLRQNEPLDRSVISSATLSSQAIIEERETLVWTEGRPSFHREATIRRCIQEESDMSTDDEANRRGAYNESLLELKISRAPSGSIILALSWEGETIATSTQDRIDRWRKVQSVFKLIGEEDIPGDLIPHAVDTSDPYDDDEYLFPKVRLFATLFPAELVEHELAQERLTAEEEEGEADPFNTESDREAWGSTLYAPDIEDAEHVLDLENMEQPFSDGAGQDLYSADTPAPDDGLTVFNPSAKRIARIATLSGMALNTGIAQEVLAFTRKSSPLMPESFDDYSPRLLNDLAIHRRTVFSMNQSLRTDHSFGLDIHPAQKNSPDYSLSISLALERCGTSGDATLMKSVFSWNLRTDDASVQNWEEICRLATRRDS